MECAYTFKHFTLKGNMQIDRKHLHTDKQASEGRKRRRLKAKGEKREKISESLLILPFWRQVTSYTEANTCSISRLLSARHKMILWLVDR